MRIRTQVAGVVVAVLALWWAAASASAAPSAVVAPSDESVAEPWVWPISPFRLLVPFTAPAHEYGPGHRGVDVAAVGSDIVRAPAAGVVAFAGTVVDRGVVTIDHGNGRVTSLEPVQPSVSVGRPVARGDPLGTLSTGGHSAPGTLHFGVRRDGEYINPLTLLGDVPRAVLLPCC